MTLNPPDWIVQLWEEWKFRLLVSRESGEGYQRLFQRTKKVVDQDFLDVRPAGRIGDFKCDGWDLESGTCYAVYAPFTRKSPAQVRAKLKKDFEGAILAWPDMRAWRAVHNDSVGLSPLIAEAVVALKLQAKTSVPHVAILAPMGPEDLWWLLRQAPASARESILGTHGWRLNTEVFAQFGGADGDPVSASAGRSVLQLIDNFSPGGLVDAVSATAFSRTLAAFFLSDSATFGQQAELVNKRCDDDAFEMMLTAIVFASCAASLWVDATGEPLEFWAEMMTATSATVPYVARLIVAAGGGQDDGDTVPGHPDDQRKVTMNIGEITTLTMQLTADAKRETVVTVLQDLLTAVQRQRDRPLDESWLSTRKTPRSMVS